MTYSTGQKFEVDTIYVKSNYLIKNSKYSNIVKYYNNLNIIYIYIYIYKTATILNSKCPNTFWDHYIHHYEKHVGTNMARQRRMHKHTLWH